MNIKEINLYKEVYLFEIDDILIERADYILQVYYLFGSFYEFTEGSPSANDIAQFMKKVRQYHGEDKVFDAAKEMFGIDEKYRENFERLQANAQIPLRINLKPDVEQLLVQLEEKGKKVAILTKGNPVEQLNKLRFIDWGKADSLRDKLKVYFEDELIFKKLNPITFIATELGVTVEDVLFLNK